MALGQQPYLATRAAIIAHLARLRGTERNNASATDYALVRQPLNSNALRAIDQAFAATRVVRDMNARVEAFEAIPNAPPWLEPVWTRMDMLDNGADEMAEAVSNGMPRVARVFWAVIRRELLRGGRLLQYAARMNRWPARPAWAVWATGDLAAQALHAELRRFARLGAGARSPGRLRRARGSHASCAKTAASSSSSKAANGACATSASSRASQTSTTAASHASHDPRHGTPGSDDWRA